MSSPAACFASRGGASVAVLGSGIANYILNTLQTALPRDELNDSLSHRELEILTLLGEGLVKKEIAQKLDISISTVATYIRRIYEKLDVQNAPAAITQACRAGILPPAAEPKVPDNFSGPQRHQDP